MRRPRSEFIWIATSVTFGVGFSLLLAAVIAYLLGWFTQWMAVPWWHLVMQVLTYELPITFFACLVSVITFRLIYKPRTPSRLYCRVEPLELDPRIVGRESPVDAGLTCISWAFPGGDGFGQLLACLEVVLEALTAQHT